jgi:hypothetical protein
LARQLEPSTKKLWVAEITSIPTEYFFASWKKDLVHGADFTTRGKARAAVVEDIEVFYNCRRHSSLGYVSQQEYE